MDAICVPTSRYLVKRFMQGAGAATAAIPLPVLTGVRGDAGAICVSGKTSWRPIVPSSEIVLLWLNEWPSHLGDAVEVQVRDKGAGIPQEIMDKLFQPYFTTEPTGESAGLGFSISYELVTAQHEFTKFTVRLPRRLAAVPAIAAETDVES
jgi:signal transduction histidine kinase